jgi:hypothetical protein
LEPGLRTRYTGGRKGPKNVKILDGSTVEGLDLEIGVCCNVSGHCVIAAGSVKSHYSSLHRELVLLSEQCFQIAWI